MKAVVFRDIGKVRLEEVPEPKLQEPADAIVRITATAICGTDLHFLRGSMPGMKPGTVLGHEGIGIVEAVGPQVRNFKAGDRVIIASTIACGSCSYCRAGYFAQCDVANPNGKLAGTAFFGGPEAAGAFNGMQAEKVRVPFANVGLIRVPDDVSDDDAILLSDIFPTAYFAAILAEITKGDTVAVFGCGPVGQLAIVSARHLGAGRVLAVDNVPDRLATAQANGAEVIDFGKEDPVKLIRELTDGIGVDRCIDCVGIDAEDASARNAPSKALHWEVQALAKAGTLSIVGAYPHTHTEFPIGEAMNKNLTLKMGNANHRKYIPELLEFVRAGVFKPSKIITQSEEISSALDAYKALDKKQLGWIKVKIRPDNEEAIEAA